MAGSGSRPPAWCWFGNSQHRHHPGVQHGFGGRRRRSSRMVCRCGVQVGDAPRRRRSTAVTKCSGYGAAARLARRDRESGQQNVTRQATGALCQRRLRSVLVVELRCTEDGADRKRLALAGICPLRRDLPQSTGRHVETDQQCRDTRCGTTFYDRSKNNNGTCPADARHEVAGRQPAQIRQRHPRPSGALRTPTPAKSSRNRCRSPESGSTRRSFTRGEAELPLWSPVAQKPRFGGECRAHPGYLAVDDAVDEGRCDCTCHSAQFLNGR